jgi:hypothetical protein
MKTTCSRATAATEIFAIIMSPLVPRLQDQWRFIQQAGLFPQGKNVLFPVA